MVSTILNAIKHVHDQPLRWLKSSVEDGHAPNRQQTEQQTMDLLNTKFLFASLIWGTVGGGYLLYARQQRAPTPFLGGVAMIAVSFLISSWFWMSLICIALMVGVHQSVKRGW